ncbi:hypothetical protein J422_07122 [Methanocaldococcus villosus KIN24-T80]|uniref:Uncharacterized protein n=1 Tax=Methanocaldococcus villosus KIN24-T80 TaxID=1069083 RepID=N6VR32_9EURY|nr:hypothetical protein [Methanocaldococcus villosus]ENN95576.1 hypothetical protein J422_07122 [Methanocaldococcus villosus KIN24-T80]
MKNDIPLNLSNSINYLINSVKEFRKGNEEMLSLIKQLSNVLDNVEKTLNIIEDKLLIIIERQKSGKEINHYVLEKFVENIENLSHVLENVDKISRSLNLEIEKHESSINNLEDTIEKLKDIDAKISKNVELELKRIHEVIDTNRSELKYISDRCDALNERLKDLLQEIDSLIS